MRVLLIDIDKQASSSKTLGCYTPDGLTSADLLTAKDVIIEKVIRHSEYGIDVIPANFELAVEIQEAVRADSRQI